MGCCVGLKAWCCSELLVVVVFLNIQNKNLNLSFKPDKATAVNKINVDIDFSNEILAV